MIKQSGIFFVIIITLLVGEYFFLRLHYQQNFSDSKLEAMLSATSTLKDQTGDPCKYSILGEPPVSAGRYLSLQLYCPTGKSVNTLDPRAVPDLTFRGVIEELGRVNGFAVEFKNNHPYKLGNLSQHWKCLSDSAQIRDYEQKVPIPSTITCTYEIQ